MKYIIELTEEEYNAVYTAVRLELQRHHGDQNAEPLLEAAFNQLRNFKIER